MFKTFEIRAAFEGRTPRTCLVAAVDAADALRTVLADPGKWLCTTQEPKHVAVTVSVN